MNSKRLQHHLLTIRSELQSQPGWGGDRYLAVDDQLRALNRCVAAAMSGGPPWVSAGSEGDDPFKEKCDHYDALIELLWRAQCGRDSTTFISLNYDTLLEAALKRDNSTHEARSSGDLYSCYGWSFLKPHGSVGFWGDFATKIGPYGYHYENVRICDPYNELGAPNLNGGSVPMRVPVMAYFARGKPCLVNDDVLQEARDRAVEASAQCTECLIIGVSFPPESDDPPLLQILQRLRGKRVLYVAGPVGAGDSNAEVASKRYGFRAELKGFEEGIQAGGVIDTFLQQPRA